jgi:quinol monooxygenase YgiN
VILLIRIRVADFGTWKPIFDEREASRKEHGGTRHWVYRSSDDPHDLVVSIEFPSARAARSYAEDPTLRDAMARAGVQGPPVFHYLEELEAVTY